SFALAISLLFLIIGLVIFFFGFRSFLRSWQTAYAVTNERVIIAVGQFGDTNSFGSHAFSSMRRTGSDEKGSIFFDYGDTGEGHAHRHGFYGIKNPAQVEALLHRTFIAPEAKVHSQTQL